jgi:hypothetical protein
MIDNLPLGAEYQYTPESISGNLAVTVNICAHSTDNTININTHHTTLCCLLDLMVKIADDGKRFSTKAILVLLDDNKCD